MYNSWEGYVNKCRRPQLLKRFWEISDRKGRHTSSLDAIPLFVGAILRLLRTRRRLLLENLALRQQLAVLKRKHARHRLAALGVGLNADGVLARNRPQLPSPRVAILRQRDLLRVFEFRFGHEQIRQTLEDAEHLGNRGDDGAS